MTDLEAALRSYADHIEVDPISIPEITGRDHITGLEYLPLSDAELISRRDLTPPARWRRPLLAAVAVAVVAVGASSLSRPGTTKVGTNASTSVAGAATTTISPTTVALSPVGGPITTRWLPTYLPAGWRVVEQTESTDAQPELVVVTRGAAVLVAQAAEPGSTLAAPDQPSLFSDRVDVGGRPGLLTGINGAVSLVLLQEPGSTTMTAWVAAKGFAEQEVIDMAATIVLDHNSATAPSAGHVADPTGPAGSTDAPRVTIQPVSGATARRIESRTASHVQLLLDDSDGDPVGYVHIQAAEPREELEVFSVLATVPVHVMPDGFAAAARISRLDEAEQKRILASLIPVDFSNGAPASGGPIPSSPAGDRPVLARLTVAANDVRLVGPAKRPCVQIGTFVSELCDISSFGLDAPSIDVGPSTEGGWLVAGSTTGKPTRVVVEFSDASTVDATIAPADAADLTLFAAVIPLALDVRSVTTFGTDGQQLERIGRPPR